MMIAASGKWFAVACSPDLRVREIIALKNMDLELQVNDLLSNIILHDNLGKFLCFAGEMKKSKSMFGCQICVKETGDRVTVIDLGGAEYGEGYLITGYSNSLGLYDVPIGMDMGQGDKWDGSAEELAMVPLSIDKLTELNNEMMNLQRELSKKNVEINDLLRKKDEMNKALEAANATKDRIFSIIGHDLRAPLANIIESMNLIAMDHTLYETLVKNGFFSSLRDSTVNTMVLLENLLEWSKEQTGEMAYFPSVFNLSEVIQEVVDALITTAAQKRIEIQSVFTSYPLVNADQRMIGTVLRNLISNAVKFTHEEGLIRVVLECDEAFARITVQDNGIGIPEDKLMSLLSFNPDHVMRGTKGETGTGFGLQLCKTLISQNGGEISFTSVEGEGSSFVISVPLSYDRAGS